MREQYHAHITSSRVSVEGQCPQTREKAEHPLQRVIAIEDTADGISVTTTDSHLARVIAEALQHAYQGDLEYHYNKKENLLRAYWTR